MAVDVIVEALAEAEEDGYERALDEPDPWYDD